MMGYKVTFGKVASRQSSRLRRQHSCQTFTVRYGRVVRFPSNAIERRQTARRRTKRRSTFQHQVFNLGIRFLVPKSAPAFTAIQNYPGMFES
jgi:hypothetical protein